MARKTKSATPRSSDQTKTRKNDSSSPEGEEEYKVGPGRPPREYQWKKGESGNPKGRKRKKPSLLPELKEILVTALSKKVTMRDGERERHLTRFETMIEQLTVQGAKGDKYARRDLIWLLKEFAPESLNPSTGPGEILPQDRKDILQRFLARETGGKHAAASSPTIAPPELVDDDAPDKPDES